MAQLLIETFTSVQNTIIGIDLVAIAGLSGFFFSMLALRKRNSDLAFLGYALVVLACGFFVWSLLRAMSGEQELLKDIKNYIGDDNLTEALKYVGSRMDNPFFDFHLLLDGLGVLLGSIGVGVMIGNTRPKQQ